jgi:hypothetical protein
MQFSGEQKGTFPPHFQNVFEWYRQKNVLQSGNSANNERIIHIVKYLGWKFDEQRLPKYKR